MCGVRRFCSVLVLEAGQSGLVSLFLLAELAIRGKIAARGNQGLVGFSLSHGIESCARLGR